MGLLYWGCEASKEIGSAPTVAYDVSPGQNYPEPKGNLHERLEIQNEKVNQRETCIRCASAVSPDVGEIEQLNSSSYRPIPLVIDLDQFDPS